MNLNTSQFKDEKNYLSSNQQNSDIKGNPFLYYNYNYQKNPEKQIQQSIQIQQQYQNVQSQESEKKKNQSQSNSKNKYLSLNDKKNQILKNMNKPQPYQIHNISIQSQNKQQKFQNINPKNEKNQQENISFSQIKNVQNDSHLMPGDQSRDNSLERQIQLFQEQQIQKRIKHNNEPQDQEQQLQKTIKISNNQFRKNLHDNSSANQLKNSQVTNSQSHLQNYNHKIQEDSSSPLKTDMITSDRIQQKKKYQNDQFSTQKNNFYNNNNECQQKLNNFPQTFYQQEESKNFSYINQNNQNNSKNDFKNQNNSFITNDNNDQLYSFQQNNFNSDFDGKYNSKLNISDIQPHNLSSKLQEQLLTTIEKGTPIQLAVKEFCQKSALYLARIQNYDFFQRDLYGFSVLNDCITRDEQQIFTEIFTTIKLNCENDEQYLKRAIEFINHKGGIGNTLLHDAAQQNNEYYG
ncbi:hypothetical protein PPERSA_04303 [Pseudocohnilembus persalinus]|uniref:Ankyrin repeat-containing domain n=1 Tax=Pseudocohnilembus persalinus TaxID=266149 RepID=A0A0V0QN65_PSEPJ|nr:hypothetical protein PPERSA_04303 [Pseudocohnilembus persalinus]|eukprot:KRX03795.1 hypothetical protein PPERSA_04303 [Pseudocohnilembus persalinus]